MVVVVVYNCFLASWFLVLQTFIAYIFIITNTMHKTGVDKITLFKTT